jgi:hypothetical protein
LKLVQYFVVYGVHMGELLCNSTLSTSIRN